MTMESPYHQLLGSIKAITEALDARDSHTRCHCDRVVDLATELGKACEIAVEDLNALRLAARFHDVGKIGIPDAVLLKNGRLSADEWVLMREHPAKGERIFVATGLPNARAVGRVIRHHHEAFNGSGYPDKLTRGDIPFPSRVLLIADAYDAMTSTRPYHAARSHDQVMGILRTESGQKLDPVIFSRFEGMIEHSALRAN